MWKEIARVHGGVKKTITEVKVVTDTLTDCESIVDAFSSQFANLIGTVHNQPCTSIDLIPHVDSVFRFDGISEECMFAMLSRLDVCKRSGTDSLSALWLRLIAPGIGSRLAYLFNQCLGGGGGCCTASLDNDSCNSGSCALRLIQL